MDPAPKQEPEKRIVLQQPVVTPPATPVVQQGIDCCGNCMGWQRQHPLAPFGQCLVAIRFLGQAMYRADRDIGCSFSDEAKEKALQRR